MTNGSVTLNGMTDEQLVTVLEAKIRHEGKLLFNPQQIHQVQQNPQRPGILLNNNVTIGWGNDDGFKAAIGLLAELASHKLLALEAA